MGFYKNFFRFIWCEITDYVLTPLKHWATGWYYEITWMIEDLEYYVREKLADAVAWVKEKLGF